MNLSSLNLDPSVPGFSLRNAVALAQASAAAYGECQISTDLCHVALLPQCDEGGRTSAMVVAFRGTKNLQDILTDAEAERVPLPNTNHGSVHAGFWRSVESVIEPLIEALDEYAMAPCASRQTPVFLTGHSKGGAEAMLAAYILSHKLHPASVAGVYTFDQPRVFDAGARASYDAILRAATWRIVNGGDIVPQVPFWHWGYRHVGQEVFLPDGNGGSKMEDGGLTQNPSSIRYYPSSGLLINPPWDITAIAKLDAYWRAWHQRRDVLLADHGIADIQARLEQEEAIRLRPGTFNAQHSTLNTR